MKIAEPKINERTISQFVLTTMWMEGESQYVGWASVHQSRTAIAKAHAGAEMLRILVPEVQTPLDLDNISIEQEALYTRVTDLYERCPDILRPLIKLAQSRPGQLQRPGKLAHALLARLGLRRTKIAKYGYATRFEISNHEIYAASARRIAEARELAAKIREMPDADKYDQRVSQYLAQRARAA